MRCAPMQIRCAAAPARCGWRPDSNPARQPKLSFLADSDAHIVRGLIAILAAIYNERPVEEVLAVDPNPVFAELGLKII